MENNWPKKLPTLSIKNGSNELDWKEAGRREGFNEAIDLCKKSLDGNTGRMELDDNGRKKLHSDFDKFLNDTFIESYHGSKAGSVEAFEKWADNLTIDEYIEYAYMFGAKFGNTGRGALDEQEVYDLLGEHWNVSRTSAARAICAKFGQNPPRAGLDEQKLYDWFIKEGYQFYHDGWLEFSRAIVARFTPPKMAGIPSDDVIDSAVFKVIMTNENYMQLPAFYVKEICRKAIHDLIEKESNA